MNKVFHFFPLRNEDNMIWAGERQKKYHDTAQILVIWSDFKHRPEEDNELTISESGSEMADTMSEPGRQNKDV